MNSTTLYYAILYASIVAFISSYSGYQASRVVELGSQLPELIGKHPDKSWYIKFYAPWCHHCQQLETIYNNVAEKIYHKYDDLIVGKVDCTKSREVCESFSVQAYPTVVLINKNTSFPFKGERNVNSMVEFADRLMGPDIHTAQNCDQLERLADEKGILVVSSIRNQTDNLYIEFKTLAASLKSTWWFYQISTTCNNLIHSEGLYLMKRHSNRSFRFNETFYGESSNLKSAITSWLHLESLPVYGNINWINFERYMKTGKMIIIAILDEYKPAKKYTKLSEELNKSFTRLAKKYARSDDEVLVARCSELDLMYSIALSEILLPNVMILNSNLTYLLLLHEAEDSSIKKTTSLPVKLQEQNIEKFIASAKLGQLDYRGGNSMIRRFFRFLYRQYMKIKNVFRADPLLASILMISPILIITFVIYNTCFTGEQQNQVGDSEDIDDSENDDDDEEDPLLDFNHEKQE